MTIFHRSILFLALVLCASSAQADSVNTASLKVNGKLVRKIYQSEQAPYPVNLSNFNIGDTLQIKVWTDHGAEYDASVNIQNLQSNHIDTITKSMRVHECLITADLLNQEHLIFATFYNSLPREHQWDWEIFHIVPDNQIEKIYASLNLLKELFLSDKDSINLLENELFFDSIAVNFTEGRRKKRQILTDTLTYSIADFAQELKISELERTFLGKYNPADNSRFRGCIAIDFENLDQFSFSLGDRTNQLEFHFRYEKDRYGLTKCIYKLK